MKDIFIQEVNTYDSLLLEEAIEKGIDLLHGKDFSFNGKDVFLKPNLLMESTPEKA